MHRGGIKIAGPADTAFYDFIKHSDIFPLASGSYGTTVLAILNPGETSSYTSIRADTFGAPVTQLVIKFAILSDESPNARAEFENEINTQTNIYLKTMSMLQPRCPGVVFSEIYTPGDFDPFEFIKEQEPNKDSLSDLLDPRYPVVRAAPLWEAMESDGTQLPSELYGFKATDQYIGIIGMEFAEGFNTVLNNMRQPSSWLYNNFYAEFRGFSQLVHLLIDVAVQTGYTQGDFHMNNIFFNESNEYYGTGPGTWMIIDFGEASKIPPETMIRIRDLYKNGKYMDIIKLLHAIVRPNGIELGSYPNKYGYVTGVYNMNNNSLRTFSASEEDEINHAVSALITHRRSIEEDTILRFNALHASEPTTYPLLPLANAARNFMYSGMIDGGRRRRRQRKTQRRKTKGKKHRRKKPSSKSNSRIHRLSKIGHFKTRHFKTLRR
jgi:hypothetical protein